MNWKAWLCRLVGHNRVRVGQWRAEFEKSEGRCVRPEVPPVPCDVHYCARCDTFLIQPSVPGWHEVPLKYVGASKLRNAHELKWERGSAA